ncbi:hypothetical protein MBLNU457_5460t1 [Dothideomycetes sp. NU457]
MTSPSSVDWSKVKVLSFDVFGTLVQQDQGQYAALMSSPLGAHLHGSRDEVLAPFKKQERSLQENQPSMKQSKIIAQAVRNYASDLGLVPDKLTEAEVEEAAAAVGHSMGEWPPFADTIDAMNRLGRHFKLVALSNVDQETFTRVCNGPLKDMDWDATYLAEDIGSYKPDLKNFDYLFDHCEKDFGTKIADGVHVANSLSHDHGPSKKIGYTSVWIDRQDRLGDADPQEHMTEWGYVSRYRTLGELADVVDAALGS